MKASRTKALPPDRFAAAVRRFVDSLARIREQMAQPVADSEWRAHVRRDLKRAMLESNHPLLSSLFHTHNGAISDFNQRTRLLEIAEGLRTGTESAPATSLSERGFVAALLTRLADGHDVRNDVAIAATKRDGGRPADPWG